MDSLNVTLFKQLRAALRHFISHVHVEPCLFSLKAPNFFADFAVIYVVPVLLYTVHYFSKMPFSKHCHSITFLARIVPLVFIAPCIEPESLPSSVLLGMYR